MKPTSVAIMLFLIVAGVLAIEYRHRDETVKHAIEACGPAPEYPGYDAELPHWDMKILQWSYCIKDGPR